MPSLRDGEVHVWAIALDLPEAEVQELGRVLRTEESARAARFRFPIHRRRFTVARAALRHLLAAYVGETAAQLELSYGPRGKPALAAHPEPWFNLSHSEELALLAVTGIAEVGVDVERLRPLSDLEAIARRFFAAGEAARILPLPAERRTAAFFRCWTRKEAYVKAVGEGLSIPLQRFEVTLEEGEPVRFLAFDDPSERPAAWTLRHLEPEPGYVGALALRAAVERVTSLRWRNRSPSSA